MIFLMSTRETVLELRKIGMSYGPRTILSDLSLDVTEGERFFVVGPSGCGKTTLLRIIAGLTRNHDGSVVIDGREMAGKSPFVPPHLRNVGFVFQDAALWPHLTVEKHLYYSRSARQNREWTEKILELTGLAHRRRDYPHTLSGGEIQRIALARALSGRPRLLLLDEPLRNLDRNLAQEMRAAIIEILDRLGTTAVFVTHDQEEAMSMAHRILLMNRENVVQVGTPEEVYHHPAGSWAARFFSAANTVRGRVAADGSLATPFGPVATGLEPGTECEAVYRPSHLEVVLEGEGASAVVLRKTFLGAVTHVAAELDGAVMTASCRGPAPEPGDRVGLRPDAAPLVFAVEDAPPPSAGEERHGS